MHGATSRRAGASALRRRTTAAANLTAACIVLSCSLAWAEATPNHVRDVKVHAASGVPGGAEIEIVGTATPTYSVRVADGGKRLFIEVANSDVVGAPQAITNGAGIVGGILTQAFNTDGGRITRVLVSLSKNASYRVQIDGTTLRVLLTPSDATTSPTAAPVAPLQAAPPPVPTTITKASPTAGTSTPSASIAAAHVTDVRFEHASPFTPGCTPLGCDRVVIALSTIPSYAMAVSASGRPRLELKSTDAPEALVRMLDVSAFKSTLRSVSTFMDPARGLTIVELDRSSDTQGNLSVEGPNLVWSFASSDGAQTAQAAKPSGTTPTAIATPIPVTTPMPTPGAAGPDTPVPTLSNVHDGRKVVTVAREFVPDLPKVETSIRGGQDTSTVETVSGAEAGFAAHMNAQAAGRYTGRRIDLDLKDADIHNILRFLADVGHVNIVAADDVSGTITIRMKNVPWDQALDVVLQAKGLGMVRNGNLVRVAPAATLQKERELALAQRVSEFQAAPLETRLIPVYYAQAGDLQPRAQDLLSPRGSISVDDRTNIMIARDISANLDYIEQLVHSLDTQTSQVLIEARIVEATSKYIRDVGIQWGGDSTFSQATGNPTGVAFPSTVTAAGGNYDNNTPTAGVSPFQRQVATPNFAVNLPAAVGTGAGGALGLSFGSIDNTLNLALRLSAAESTGLVRIVSSPRILTLDNREARINQGTLIPFAQVSALGVQTTFQEAKLQLLVRPHVTADGTVSMHVKVTRDEPDFNQTSPRGDPTILKREAETDLLVMDGHTAVIGGIYTRNTGRNVDQVPFFGDIPIIGILFQRRRASDSRNELVIFLTPRIVNRDTSLGH